jgi:hypothetical protein
VYTRKNLAVQSSSAAEHDTFAGQYHTRLPPRTCDSEAHQRGALLIRTSAHASAKDTGTAHAPGASVRMCDFLKCVCERLHASRHFKREQSSKRENASLHTCACACQRETIGDIERWREFCHWLPYGAALPCPCETHTNSSHHSCLFISGTH